MEGHDRNRLTWKAYWELGGCRQALASVADELYTRLTADEKVTLKRIFIRCLTRPGDVTIASGRQGVRLGQLYDIGQPPDSVDSVLKRLEEVQLVRVTNQTVQAADGKTTFVRRRVRVTELDGIGRPPIKVHSVLEKLAKAQLVRVTGDPNVPDDQQVEVAHERLLSSWGKLRGWLDHEQEVILRRQRLIDRAREWDIRKRDESLLLRAPSSMRCSPG